MLSIAIVGFGFVGKATAIFARAPNVKCVVYDIDASKCSPPHVTLKEVCEESQVIFVCVPTPMHIESGVCDVSIVEGIVKQIKNIGTQAETIIRSTVPPGTCERLGVWHMPEYLTEKNWEQDFIGTRCWELGMPVETTDAPLHIRSLLRNCCALGVIASDTLKIRHTSVTETAKYMRNVMLAVRIGVCNEIEAFCRAKGINYDQVRELATSDPRIGDSHTSVPGPDGERGFGGTCLPKDIQGLIMEMLREGCSPMILQACSHRNETIDRPTRDWMTQVGRTVNANNNNNSQANNNNSHANNNNSHANNNNSQANNNNSHANNNNNSHANNNNNSHANNNNNSHANNNNN
jgi:nucleotide sugar dehydrogenase